MTSCHVSLKLKMGPVSAQTITRSAATKNVSGLPVQIAVAQAISENKSDQVLRLLRTYGRLSAANDAPWRAPPAAFLPFCAMSVLRSRAEPGAGPSGKCRPSSSGSLRAAEPILGRTPPYPDFDAAPRRSPARQDAAWIFV